MPAEFKKIIRTIPDFPRKGILFYDLAPLFADPKSFRRATDIFAQRYIDNLPDRFAGIEARGFIIASSLAYALGRGLTMIRKHGKLPYKTNKVSYDLEYGESIIEIHRDAIKPQEKVVIVDDLLATGGTVKAATQLIEGLGGIVQEIGFLVELKFLEGRNKLPGKNIFSVLEYD